MKLIKLTLCLGLAGMAVAGTAHARGVIDSSTIAQITSSGSSAYLINTGTDSRAVSGETIPSCATNTRSMTIAASDRANYALLLTAYASGKQVRLVGAGACNEVGSVESIGFIQVKD